ncbi:hypothetical protein HBH56_120570 [Parastagonospora nodorum]|uniref:Uncharacterized protein n=1 Tax=Phaeosphaeria nodorum (strain SN15 / ATCC MYA-4574 / FGSC 10173) TaxID=321614 RepID=A0A7U2FEV5_PHANO|nr:hypothetical protein HBH56_120570 [Parastagonospora nodorum]QRD03959.1 hypothetical protein JI435_442690 [Parastagonospora nodorum SN15]KAH3924187.1 hypothetical protein HBH54_196470 [Parastagonospora nodorum]KAH3968541.1 hypothetical protein HBH52_178920 [Parastagonospora nodorum]KAH4046051.1 hypothetical protein HBH49_192750 [Parastagonospora nodorum]
MANSKSTPMLRRSKSTCVDLKRALRHFGIKSVRPDGSSGTNHCLFTQAYSDTCELLEEYLNFGHATRQVLHDMVYLGTTTSTPTNHAVRRANRVATICEPIPPARCFFVSIPWQSSYFSSRSLNPAFTQGAYP